jgi:hypothetical protein
VVLHLLAVKLAVLLGTVTIGPTGPLCSDPAACDRPASDVKLTFTRLGHSYSTRTTDAGTYRIKLKPGIYVVRADTGIVITPKRINVRRPTTRLNLAIDPGGR